MRVLKPGGKLVIADIRETHHYAQRLRALGMVVADPHTLGWRFCYGSPWIVAKLVQATKPSVLR